jgi:hypothetical protein
MSDSDSDGYGSGSDNDFELEKDPMIEYDERVTSVYNSTVPDGRFALSMVDGNFEKAYEILQKTSDAQQYLTDIGAIRIPNIDRRALMRFCANPVAYSDFQHSKLISMLPYAIIASYNLGFVKLGDEYPICAQDAQLHAVCDQSQNTASCYEEKLGLTPQPNTSSSVVLSKQLIRFMCHNVNRMLIYAQITAIQTIDSIILDNWYRFRQIRGEEQFTYVNVNVISHPVPLIPALSISVSKNAYITMLKNEFAMSDTQARSNTTADTFRDYVKRQFKELIIIPNARRLEHAIMKNNSVRYEVTATADARF